MSAGYDQSVGEQPRSVLELETVISDLSAKFISLTPGAIDREIEDGLRRICEPLGIDLAVLWQWSNAVPLVIRPTHTYDPLDALPKTEPLHQDLYPWVVRQMIAGRVVTIRSMDDMPEDFAVDRENAKRLGLHSNLTLPLAVGGEPPLGALAFNTLRAERDWSEDLVKRRASRHTDPDQRPREAAPRSEAARE